MNVTAFVTRSATVKSIDGYDRGVGQQAGTAALR